MKSATLLVELLTEELPPKALKALGAAFAGSIAEALRARGFLDAHSVVSAYATPRRLAVAITSVAAEVTEPARAVPLLPVTVAFGADGAPTEALEKAIKAKAGFAAFSAVPAERIERRHDGKMERLVYLEPPAAVPLTQKSRQMIILARHTSLIRRTRRTVAPYSTTAASTWMMMNSHQGENIHIACELM